MDTLFSDISEFQNPVDDSYPYPVLSIRVSDGTYRDHKFAQNYAWMRRALDSGRLVVGIVYTYVRPNWEANRDTVIDMFNRNGGLHPKVALMLDVESGGNPPGDGSDWINKLYWALADWCGDRRRVFGYANRGDYDNLWRTRPDGLRIIGAGYGQNPNLPGQIAHQYTDGVYGGGPGLPLGAPPFGNCDMNSANGLDPLQLAATVGVTTVGDDMANVPQDQWDRVYFELTNRWNSRSPFRALGEGPVDTTVGMILNTDGMVHTELIEKLAVTYHDPDSIQRLKDIAAADPKQYPDRQADAALAKRILSKVIL